MTVQPRQVDGHRTLAATLGRRLVTPQDDDYEEARAIWNGMHDKRPALIVRCDSAADVVRAIDHARENGMKVAVRGGGHGVAGKATCEGGLVIDLSPMRGVQVDPERKVARVEGGATGFDLDSAAQAHGLAVTMGTDPSTGVAGLTLGGGMGFLARRCGLAADNLLAAEVVLVDGSHVRASARENPDLFWALRGGGGNFGVVTAFEFRLHDIGPEVYVAQAFHPYENAKEVLRFYRDFTAAMPAEVGCYFLVMAVPPGEPVPQEHWGQPAVVLAACHSGALDAASGALAPIESFGSPLFLSATSMPYLALQTAFQGAYPKGQRYYWKSHYLSALGDDAIDAVVRRAGALPSRLSSVFLEAMGGAINAVAPDATAFPHRRAAYNLGICAGWTDAADDARSIGWAKDFHRETTPFSTGGVYVNYVDHDEAGRLPAAFGDNLDRLRRVKSHYDPDNFFDSNQNVQPR